MSDKEFTSNEFDLKRHEIRNETEDQSQGEESDLTNSKISVEDNGKQFDEQNNDDDDVIKDPTSYLKMNNLTHEALKLNKNSENQEKELLQRVENILKETEMDATNDKAELNNDGVTLQQESLYDATPNNSASNTQRNQEEQLDRPLTQMKHNPTLESNQSVFAQPSEMTNNFELHYNGDRQSLSSSERKFSNETITAEVHAGEDDLNLHNGSVRTNYYEDVGSLVTAPHVTTDGSRRVRTTSRCSTSEMTTDTEYGATGAGGSGATGGRKRRIQQKSRSPAMLYSVARRSSIGSSSGMISPLSQPEDRQSIDEELPVIAELTSSESDVSFRSMSRDKKFTVINFCLTNFCVGAFYSLLAPFFSTEAYKKGVSSTVVGLIFGTFELTLVLTAPIFGTFITQIGARFMYITGVMVCGSGAILFGLLDQSPDGTVYIVLCFVVRFVEALGASAFSTASFAIMANTFPNNVAAMFGSLELFSGLGLMIGPPIGGALFQLGGFKLPFMSLGSLVIAVGIVSCFMLPHQNVVMIPSEGSVLSLLKIPIIPIVGLCLFCGAGSLGFFDVTLSDFLTKTFNLTPLVIGFVFLVGPGVYAITAPIWGWISDKFPQWNRVLICFGYTVSGLAMFFVGPAPFFHITPALWLPILSNAVNGFGVATLVIAFPVITEAALQAGNPDNLATYGLIAGVFNAFFSLGACVGPLCGGYLHEVLKFEMASVVVGCCELFAAFTLMVFLIVNRLCSKQLETSGDISTTAAEKNQTDEERQPLLSNGCTVRDYGYSDDMDRESSAVVYNNEKRTSETEHRNSEPEHFRTSHRDYNT